MVCNCIGGNPCPCQGGGRLIGRIEFNGRYWGPPSTPPLEFGVYACSRCSKPYMVNDGTWRRCTPDFCHDCYEHICKQFALVPVDKDGKDVAQ